MRRLTWRFPRRRWRIVAQVAEADLVPDQIVTHGIVTVGSPSAGKWAVFDCPCGSERIMLNLDRTRPPAWSLSQSLLRGASIHPSVDTHHDGRRCHYYIRTGRVLWAQGNREERR